MSGMIRGRFGSRQELISLRRSIQELDPVHREGDGRAILLHLSSQKVRSYLVQHVAETVIDFRKQNRLVDAGGVLEGDELHGVAVLCLHCLAGDQPPDGGDMLTHMEMKITCVYMMQPS